MATVLPPIVNRQKNGAWNRMSITVLSVKEVPDFAIEVIITSGSINQT